MTLARRPTRLYKYLPSKYLTKVVERGDLLFRNLSFFRQSEAEGRRDLLEGLHMDKPDNDLTLQTLDGRKTWKGQGAFLNSINSNKLFAFCLSEKHTPALYDEFEADACIEILHPDEFLHRCDATISRQRRFSDSGLIHGEVEYYAPNKSAKRNVKDPRQIPFFKHEAYHHQLEYRLVVALHGGLQLTERIVNHLFSFEEDVASGRPDHRHVFIGSITDIVKIHNVGDMERVLDSTD